MSARIRMLSLPGRSWAFGCASAPVLDLPDMYPGVLRAIADIAHAFVTVEPDEIDRSIVDSLKCISDELEFDWAALWQIDTESSSTIASYGRSGPQPLRLESLSLRSMPHVASRLELREPYWFTGIEEIPNAVDREAFLQHGVRTAAVVPVPLAGAASMESVAFAAGSVTAEREWSPEIIESLRVVSGIFGQALMRKASLSALQRARDELRDVRALVDTQEISGHLEAAVPPSSRLRDRWQTRDVYLRRETEEQFGAIVGRSAGIRGVLEQAQQVAATGSTVLLLGETGTGKELIATQIHDMSPRRGRQMVRVNCAAIPTTLIESELFGHEKGAFTGAFARQIGRFECADRSTIFLDEIGDLSGEVQVKLLRVLEERQIEPLGSSKAVHVDVRIIAATHRNLEKHIADNAFREDLFYRLNVFPIRVPPLRERAQDIPLLVWRFVDEFSKASGKRVDAIDSDDMAALQRYSWPGNIRELRNVVERAMIIATDTRLSVSLPASPGPSECPSTRMDDVEREHIRAILGSTGWRIRGSNGAAERLGLRPTTLETRMAKLGLVRPKRACDVLQRRSP